MSAQGDLNALQGIHRDLISLSKTQLQNVERLWSELDARVDEFKQLLDKPRKNETSRRSLLSGTLSVEENEYAVNQEFQENATQLADTLDLDEVESAKLLLEAQEQIETLDRSIIAAAIISFHQRRQYLLECLRLTVSYSLDADVEDDTRSVSRELLALILETKDGTSQNGSAYIRKCLQAMFDNERWLLELGDRIQGIKALGQTLSQEGDEILKFQQQSLAQQHESLSATISLLVKASYSTADNFQTLLDHVAKVERWSPLIVHYTPLILVLVSQHGSPEGIGSLHEARALHDKLFDGKDSSVWKLRNFQAATQAWWLAEYSGWYQEHPAGSPLQGVDLEAEAIGRSESFFQALRDGAFECTLTICSQITPQEWYDPARSSLIAFLLRDAPSLQPDPAPTSDWFRLLLMEQLESFVEALITNMPNTLRQFKSEEDDQRKRIHSNLQPKDRGGTFEQDLHLERFLVIISFSFDLRIDAAQTFWADTDSNLYGFLQWASRRQSTPSVGAFCEMLRSISKSEVYATAAHHFLLEDPGVSFSRIRRSSSLSWAHIFGELSIYSARVREPAASGKGTNIYGGKPNPDDIEEPESVLMLESYLRLMSHLCSESSEARSWILSQSNPAILDTMFVLCSPTVPNSLQACAYIMVQSLISPDSTENTMNIWNMLDIWASGGYAPPNSARAPKLANPNLWLQEVTFSGIISTFDQANDFTALLHSLMSPTHAFNGLNDRLPFPETLGSSYRMPGVGPFIDLVLDNIFVGISTQIEDRLRTRVLRYNVLNFVTTCLSNFNEDLLILGSKSSSAADEGMSASSITAYLRLHPFCRVMEWLFNDRVLSVLFDAARENVDDLASEPDNSPAVLSLLRTVQTMDKVMDLQSTYLNIARPLVKAQSTRGHVHNASLASFEDSVAMRLHLVVDLGLYAGLGNSDLAIASLKLLSKLASSRRLRANLVQQSNRLQSGNPLVSVLEREDGRDRVARPLISTMELDPRELEAGPNSGDWTLKSVVLEFLVQTLIASPDQPSLAHALLGFFCKNTTVEIVPHGLFSKGLSLFHSIVQLVAEYPDGAGGHMQMWALSLRQMGMEVLSILWRSPLTTSITISELRDSELFFRLSVRQRIVDTDTLWEGRSIREPDFMVSPSAETLQQYLWQRNSYYQYANTEIRALTSEGSPSLKTRLFSTLLGSTSSPEGEQYANPSILDLLDFLEFEIPSLVVLPQHGLLSNLDFDLCAQDFGGVGGLTYNLQLVDHMLAIRLNELRKSGRLQNPNDEQQANSEAGLLLEYFRALNSLDGLRSASYRTLESWSQLIVLAVEVCDMEDDGRLSLVMQALQVLTPKLEAFAVENDPRTISIASSVRMLLLLLDFGSVAVQSTGIGDFANDRLYQVFRAAVRGISTPETSLELREILYNLCFRYLALMSQLSDLSTIQGSVMQTIKMAGLRMFEMLCDDAFSANPTCRIAALLLLDALAKIAEREMSSHIIESLIRSNFLQVVVESIETISTDLRETSAQDIPLLLTFYEAKFSLLLTVSRSKIGAVQVISAGMFHAVRSSGLFSVDPDIGIEINNPEALAKYYKLLLFITRIIASVVLSCGENNQQTIEDGRRFLEDHRALVVSTFKRQAKVGGISFDGAGINIDELVELFTLLISITGFLEYEEQGGLSVRGSFGFT